MRLKGAINNRFEWILPKGYLLVHGDVKMLKNGPRSSAVGNVSDCRFRGH